MRYPQAGLLCLTRNFRVAIVTSPNRAYPPTSVSSTENVCSAKQKAPLARTWGAFCISGNSFLTVAKPMHAIGLFVHVLVRKIDSILDLARLDLALLSHLFLRWIDSSAVDPWRGDYPLLLL